MKFVVYRTEASLPPEERVVCKVSMFQYADGFTNGDVTWYALRIKITVTVNRAARVGKELVNNAQASSVTSDSVLTNNMVVQKTMVAK
jgi:hypothetical protein